MRVLRIGPGYGCEERGGVERCEFWKFMFTY